MGFKRNSLVDSLQNRAQNEGTVAYFLLLDNRFRVATGYFGDDFKETMETGYNCMNVSDIAAASVGHRLPGAIDYQHFGARQLTVDRKWALGLQSQAHPREIMSEVLKALQELNVFWKKIGQYNMKCRWIHGIRGEDEGNAKNPITIIRMEMSLLLVPIAMTEILGHKMWSSLKCSFIKLARTSTCLICREFKGHSSCFLISVLSFLPNFVSCELVIFPPQTL